tara:strand:- start:117686 stop:117997 length:312 start_codon:yes stop_codon:yes gene_type:complete
MAFSEGMVDNFKDSILPEFLLIPFSLALPFIEFFIGLFLVLGWQTKTAAFGGGVLMLVLIGGTTLIENWAGLPTQMIHLLFFVLVYEFNNANGWALDRSQEIK